ncbi:MAG TPA: GAF domain-containing protein [Myxococcota bacterium]|nr:GAF domain-containing protein [Myxococcota bacterium]
MSPRQGAVEVSAGNWVVALGMGLEQFGAIVGLDRLACEVLQNGQVLARDVRAGQGWVVQPMGLVLPPIEDPTLDDETMEAPEDTADAGWLHVIGAAKSMEEAAQKALNLLGTLIPAEGGAVLKLLEDLSLEFIWATGPSGRSLIGHRLAAGVGIAGFCVKNAATVNSLEPYADQRFHREVDAATGQRTHSVLCVPLVHDGLVMGCLELINARGNQGFTRGAQADTELVAGALAARMGLGGPVRTPAA